MEEIINSVMQSPENTNPNVLRSQLSKISGGSGGGGVSSYNDLTDTPMRVENPVYTQDDAIGTGVWSVVTLVKVSNESYNLNDLLGTELVANKEKLTMSSSNTENIAPELAEVGYTGSFCINCVNETGDRLHFLSCDADFYYEVDGNVVVSVTAGTYIADYIDSATLPTRVVVTAPYDSLFKPGAVYATFIEDENNNAVCNKTFAELYSAYNAGCAVFALVNLRGNPNPLLIPLAPHIGNSSYMVGQSVFYYAFSSGSLTLTAVRVDVYDDGSVHYYRDNYIISTTGPSL